MEEQEREEEVAGSKISVKRTKAKGGKASGRQTKLPTATQNSLKHTKPSPFAETIAPEVPQFNPNPKKASVPRLKVVRVKKDKGEDGVKGESSEVSEGTEAKKKSKIAAATAIKESFISSGEEDDEVDVSMDLATRIANRPSRAKAAPTSYAVDLSDNESGEREDQGDVLTNSGSDTKQASKPSSKTVKLSSSNTAREDSEPISIPDSDSDDDFITPPPPKKAKVPAKKAAVVTVTKAAVVTVTKAASKVDKPAKSKAKPSEKPVKPAKGAAGRGVGKKESKGALKKAVNKPPQSKSQATLRMFSKPSPAEREEEEEEGKGEGEGEGEGDSEEEDVPAPVVAKKSRSGPKVGVFFCSSHFLTFSWALEDCI